jgi:predicted esterase
VPATPSSEKHKCGVMCLGLGQDHLLFVFLLVLASLSNSEIFSIRKKTERIR